MLAILPIALFLSPLELDTVLDEVSRHAPAVHVRQASVAEARAAVGVAGAWEDPVVSVMADFLPLPGGESDPMLTYRISQPLNLFGRRAAAKRAAGAQVAAQQSNLRRATWDARAQAVSLFYELWMNGEMRAVIERQIELLQRMRDAALARVRAGMGMGHHDVLRAEAEIKKMEAERASLADERAATVSMLNALRGRPQDEAIAAVAPPSRSALPPLEAVLGGVSLRPEVAAARAMRAEAEAKRDLARKMYLPMVMVEAQYDQRSGMSDAFGASLVFSVPLWWWDRQSREVQMAQAMVARADTDISAMRTMSEADVRMAWSRAQADARRLAALEDGAIPAMTETVASAQASYSAGRAEFLSLLDAALALRELQAARLTAIVAYEVDRYELARLLGARLEEIRP
jgi:outer membrane protein, heavy metal efflux system